MADPTYVVWGYSAPLYETHSLRRAWEATRWFRQQGEQADVFVPERQDLDTDGLSDDESALLDEWTVFGADGRVARFHFCLAPEDSEMAARARRAEQARAA
jgi:hypothetical protein